MFCSNCGAKNSDDFKFCPSCGQKRKIEDDVSVVSNNGLDSFREISQTIHVYFLGKDGDVLDEVIAKSLGQKKSSNILFNLYASDKYFVVLPVSKDKGRMVLWALLLGGGALAGAAMGALEVLSKKLESKDAETVSQKDDALKSALIFSRDTLNLSVKEVRANTGSLSDFFKKETWFLISGLGFYNGKEYEVAVKFGFAGQESNLSKPKLGVLDKICSVLRFEYPIIHSGKNSPF